ncbi:MAG: hypothetical protein COV91_05920 [Candidatus Taylorbacteria bacterium CG11_big_fil_rev_8_21_14_0_20_46_11]|uniref:Uncharacterized protein n=1 Tax=Candidatus Taylorbacteria bacterium CG11_big_fil_rev_8_21_14_0_20_46_11 TaxID=1975025 RepID=A0A2H0KCJ0_9BACT|nr:MAG: hypothetical protein COV91_05920 [Candidatus Taylorbacteria bacterium CG11_big_fil_rev_8_21_14_0_20_46_11]
MGTFFEQNDTLQITKEQGFPPKFSLETHLSKPYSAEDFKNTLFSFSEKKGIRNYHVPQVTSGTFKLLYLYTPEEMKLAHKLMDQRNETDFF